MIPSMTPRAFLLLFRVSRLPEDPQRQESMQGSQVWRLLWVCVVLCPCCGQQLFLPTLSNFDQSSLGSSSIKAQATYQRTTFGGVGSILRRFPRTQSTWYTVSQLCGQTASAPPLPLLRHTIFLPSSGYQLSRSQDLSCEVGVSQEKGERQSQAQDKGQLGLKNPCSSGAGISWFSVMKVLAPSVL